MAEIHGILLALNILEEKDTTTYIGFMRNKTIHGNKKADKLAKKAVKEMIGKKIP